MKQNYDIILIGSQFTSLCLASLLSQDHSVLLISDENRLNDSQTPENPLEMNPLFQSLRYPHSPSLETLFQKLGLETQVQNQPPKTVSKGKFKDFLAFGDSTPKSFDIVKYFLNQDWLHIDKSLSSTLVSLLESGTFHRIDTKVIEILSDEGKVTGVETSLGKTFKAPLVYLTQNIKQIPKLIDADSLDPKSLAKIGKTKYFSMLSMICNLSPERAEQRNCPWDTTIIMPGKKEKKIEFGPYFGLFTENPHKTLWITFAEEDYSSDGDIIVKFLKKLKMQAARVGLRIKTSWKPLFSVKLDDIGISDFRHSANEDIFLEGFKIISGETYEEPFLEGEAKALIDFLEATPPLEKAKESDYPEPLQDVAEPTPPAL